MFVHESLLMNKGLQENCAAASSPALFLGVMGVILAHLSHLKKEYWSDGRESLARAWGHMGEKRVNFGCEWAVPIKDIFCATVLWQQLEPPP